MLEDHEAIRAHMNFLAKSLDKMSDKSVDVKERLWSYRQGLHDFREAVLNHIERDEAIFRALLKNAPVDESLAEHDDIHELVALAIRAADYAINHELSQAEMNQCALKIKTVFTRACQLIQEHTAKEDELLKRLSRDA
ncbi:MAG: hypothetical protein A2Z05_06550 [Chloroflexi bacterium RBG_16_60_22]|nr:MAG: hypothetical protein A2Z05_06550 [Chloroflexi bacterium RBG_16_60_22]